MNKQLSEKEIEEIASDIRDSLYIEGVLFAIRKNIQHLEDNRENFQQKFDRLDKKIKAFKLQNNHKCKGKKNAKPIRKSVLK